MNKTTKVHKIFALTTLTFIMSTNLVNLPLLAQESQEQPTKKDPDADNFAQIFYRGVERFKRADYPGAIEDFTQVIKKQKNLAEAYHNRAYAYQMLGKYDQAIADYTEAIKYKVDPETYTGRANVYLLKENYNLAIADYDQAIEIKPEDTILYLKRAEIKEKIKDFSGVIDDLSVIINSGDKNTQAYIKRGIAQGELGAYPEAIADFTKAIEIEPESAALAYQNRGIVKRKAGDLPGALEDYNQSLQLDGKNYETYYHRGVLLQLLGDTQGASNDYNQAVKINPEYAPAYGNRALLYYQNGKKDDAIADIKLAARYFNSQKSYADYQKSMQFLRQLLTE
jgi:tetratricopeptide (TPR) repeat protein